MALSGIEYTYFPDDLVPDRAIGIKLPFNQSAAGKSYNTMYSSSVAGGSVFSLSYTTEEQAISNLKNLLLTRKGERLYHPNFGSSLYDTLFENISNDDEFESTIEDSVRSDINFWLPYINIIQLSVNVLPYRNISDVNNGVNIYLKYSVGKAGSNLEIEVEFNGTNINIIE